MSVGLAVMSLMINRTNCLIWPVCVHAAVTSVHLNSLSNLVNFTCQDYVVTDFQIVKELLMPLVHQFYKVSTLSFLVESTKLTRLTVVVLVTFARSYGCIETL